MRLIQIKALNNGAHRNKTVFNKVTPPTGWAIIPENMVTPNFPFGEVEAEEIGGVMTLTKWTPGEIPEPESEPEKTSLQLREEAYNTTPCIEWGSETLTVTQASQKWQYYSAEGSPKAEELQVLIATAKAEIREKYPDTTQ